MRVNCDAATDTLTGVLRDAPVAESDESLEDSTSLPEPHLLAQEIVDDLRSALGQIEDVLGDLETRVAGLEVPPDGPRSGPAISPP